MIIERGNIKLLRLTEEYIELVRTWRNAPEIKKRMEYQEYITPEMQREWFSKINNVNNNYFLIETNNKHIGLINGANIGWDKGVTNNGGIFIWDKEYLESFEIVQASLLLTDLGYYLGMKKNYIKILKDNARAIAFNKSIGYRLLPRQENEYNQQYQLIPSVYFKATEKIRRKFGINDVLKLSVTPAEYKWYIELTKKAGLNKNKHLQNILVEII